MKKTNNVIKMFVAGISVMSVMFLVSCNKDMRDKTAVQSSSVSDGTLANTPVALWGFDSSWTESKQGLIGKTHNAATFSSTEKAHDGIAAFLSNKNGYVSYNNAGTALPNLTTGFTVDFWVYANPKEGGAQCIWCIPQTVDQNGNPAFWPTHHVLLDGYNSAKGDTGLIKIMFKANRNINYNEEWTEIGNIPNFYHRWSHIKYSYDGATSKFTAIVNGTTYVDGATKYTDDPMTTGVPLGNIVANPGTHGIVIGAFQNTWDPTLFGAPQVWMLPFKGRIDNLKVYNKALF